MWRQGFQEFKTQPPAYIEFDASLGYIRSYFNKLNLTFKKIGNIFLLFIISEALVCGHVALLLWA